MQWQYKKFDHYWAILCVLPRAVSGPLPLSCSVLRPLSCLNFCLPHRPGAPGQLLGCLSRSSGTPPSAQMQKTPEKGKTKTPQESISRSVQFDHHTQRLRQQSILVIFSDLSECIVQFLGLIHKWTHTGCQKPVIQGISSGKASRHNSSLTPTSSNRRLHN